MLKCSQQLAKLPTHSYDIVSLKLSTCGYIDLFLAQFLKMIVILGSLMEQSLHCGFEILYLEFYALAN